jgi:hypothetical protein
MLDFIEGGKPVGISAKDSQFVGETCEHFDLRRARQTLELSDETRTIVSAFHFSFNDLMAQVDTLATDVDISRPFNQRPDILVALPAKRAIGVSGAWLFTHFHFPS